MTTVSQVGKTPITGVLSSSTSAGRTSDVSSNIKIFETSSVKNTNVVDLKQQREKEFLSFVDTKLDMPYYKTKVIEKGGTRYLQISRPDLGRDEELKPEYPFDSYNKEQQEKYSLGTIKEKLLIKDFVIRDAQGGYKELRDSVHRIDEDVPYSKINYDDTIVDKGCDILIPVDSLGEKKQYIFFSGKENEEIKAATAKLKGED